MNSLPETPNNPIPVEDRAEDIRPANLIPQSSSSKAKAPNQLITITRDIWRNILSYVPGTLDFKRAVWRLIANDMKFWRMYIQLLTLLIDKSGSLNDKSRSDINMEAHSI